MFHKLFRKFRKRRCCHKHDHGLEDFEAGKLRRKSVHDPGGKIKPRGIKARKKRHYLKGRELIHERLYL